MVSVMNELEVKFNLIRETPKYPLKIKALYYYDNQLRYICPYCGVETKLPMDKPDREGGPVWEADTVGTGSDMRMNVVGSIRQKSPPNGKMCHYNIMNNTFVPHPDHEVKHFWPKLQELLDFESIEVSTRG